MNPIQPEKRRRILSARRLVLLASVAGLGAAVIFGGPAMNSAVSLFSPSMAAQAAEVAPPTGFADIIQAVKPSVVSVRVKLNDDSSDATTGFNNDDNGSPLQPGTPFYRFFRQFGMPNLPNMPQGQHHFTMAQGSGFFISADGYLVTNNHVVNHAKSVEITTDKGKTYAAKVVGTDPKTDLALLKVDGHNDFPYATFESAKPRIGDWVLAVGNPFGLGGTVTAGIVSADGRDIGEGPYDDFIQIDAPVNRGNSGGPAFDTAGKVIGVTTAIYTPSGGSVGIGFAIPADTVKYVVGELKDKGAVTRGWIGVQIQPVTKDIADSLGLKSEEGALVSQPQENGPAAKAGIKAGDVIKSVDGKEIKDPRDLAKKVATISPGATAQIGIVRNGSDKTVAVKLEKYPSDKQVRTDFGQHQNKVGESKSLGLTLAPASTVEGAGDQGVVVTNVDPNGPAAERGVQTGDVILDVAGKAVSTPSDVREAVNAAHKSGKHAVLMRIKSKQGTRFVALPVARG